LDSCCGCVGILQLQYSTKELRMMMMPLQQRQITIAAKRHSYRGTADSRGMARLMLLLGILWLASSNRPSTRILTHAFAPPIQGISRVPYHPQHNQRQHSLFVSLSSSNSKKGTGGRNNNKKKNNNNNKKKGKPRSKVLQFDKRSRDPSNNSPRPLLTDYTANRNDAVNRQRLTQQQIGCEHFGQCSGCVVDSKVGTVDKVRAAQQYFSSTAVRRKRCDVVEQGLEEWAHVVGRANSYGDYDDDDNASRIGDGFYQVVVPSPLTGWRTQAKLVVAPKTSSWSQRDGCTLGLYQRGTHTVLPIPNCQVHHPHINQAIQLLEQATARVGTPAYNEDTREGGLRFVQLQVDRSTGGISLTLVWNAANLKETHPGLTLLKNELLKLDKTLWHSIWCHCNDGFGNNIFHKSPKRWHRLTGHEFLREPVPTGDQGYLYFSPLTFRQGNLDGFDILALDVAQHVPGGSKVCELYAGVGVLGLTALTYHAGTNGIDYNDDNDQQHEPLQWVRCSDLNPANPRCFHRAVASLPRHVTHNDPTHTSASSDGEMTLADLAKMMESGQEPSLPSSSSGEEVSRPKTSYTAASAADALLQGQALGANVLIVDPPRKGLEDEVVHELCKPFNPSQPYVESATLLTIPDHKVNWANDVNTLIYVSCGFDALARDSEKLLTSSGGWMLESATGYILFPGSDHVESVCVFQRK